MVFLDMLAIFFLYYKKQPNRLSRRILEGIIHGSHPVWSQDYFALRHVSAQIILWPRNTLARNIFGPRIKFSMWCRNRGGHWTPQYLSDQLTLFGPGRADYPHLLLLAPPKVFTFRQHWEVNSLTLHNLHYIVLALCKAARPAQMKEKIKILVL